MNAHGGLHRRRLQQQVAGETQRARALADRSRAQARLLGLLATLSGSLARREKVETLLAETLLGVLNLAGISRGALLVHLDRSKRPLVFFRGFTAQEVHVVHAVLQDCDVIPSSGSAAADLSERLEAELGSIRSAAFAPLCFGNERLGALMLASGDVSLHDPTWRSFTALIAAQIGQALFLGQALGQAGASEQRYRAVMENSNDGIFVLSQDGVILESNAQGIALLQRPGDQVVGRLLADYLVADPARVPRGRFLDLLSDGNLHTDHVELRLPDGQTIDIDLCTRRAQIDGQPAVIAVTHDVTERNRLETQLCQWQKLEAMGGLAVSVSHDFNNILAVIQAHASLLLRELPEGDARRDDVEGVQAGAQRGVALVRQLMDFTRVGSKDLSAVPVNRTIRAVVPLLRRLLGPTVNVDTTLEARPDQIAADLAQIEQVIMNLAVNARDAMPGGGELHLATSDVVLKGEAAHNGQPIPDGRYLLLAVRDTGVGMDPTTLKRLFDPFFTTKPVGQGTGLGLSTCQVIVNRCRGFMAVDSAEDAGTTFRCYFPLLADAKASGLTTLLGDPAA